MTSIKNLTLRIPLINIPDVPIVASSQEHLPIEDIVDSLIVYKDGGAALVLESTSLNFGLLSENEQEAVIAAYAALLNTLSFSIQILVRSQRKDISNYLDYLEKAQQKIKNPKLEALMTGYKTFISETIKKKNVLGKRFYIILMFSPLELGVAKSFLAFSKRSKVLPFSKEYVVKKAKITLYPRKDHLSRQASRLGLKLRELTRPELLELFYDVYNPKTPLTSIRDESEIENET